MLDVLGCVGYSVVFMAIPSYYGLSGLFWAILGCLHCSGAQGCMFQGKTEQLNKGL